MSGAKFGPVREEDARLEDYVTRKALDGLFVNIAEEEKKVRQDPASAASAILSKVFGVLRNSSSAARTLPSTGGPSSVAQ